MESNRAFKFGLMKDNPAVLGVLEGICADIEIPTRNGRFYSETLWDKVFNDEIVKEGFEKGGVFGEAAHPVDRIETEPEKIAIAMKEPPIKKDGKLVGRFYILDTPCGRILKTLADFGYQIGISSRGEGDVVEDFNGNQVVNEDTYRFECFDAVLLPAVKSARMKLVTEGVNKQTTLKEALDKCISTSTTDDQKVMTETLKELNIEYTPEKVIDKVLEETPIAANNAGAKVVGELQESLLRQQKLESQLLELQEKLSVCYAKEAKYEDDITKYKATICTLSEKAHNVKALESQLTTLKEQLVAKDAVIQKQNRDTRLKVSNDLTKLNHQNTRLTETLNARSRELNNSNRELVALKEQLTTLTERNSTINEDLATARKNLSIKTNEYNSKLTRANSLVEQYRKTAKTAVDKYISMRADILGITNEEILHKLPENYSFNDIDRICESISNYKVNLGNLPFDLDEVKRGKLTGSVVSPLTKERSNTYDDSVDEDLLKLANI